MGSSDNTNGKHFDGWAEKVFQVAPRKKIGKQVVVAPQAVFAFDESEAVTTARVIFKHALRRQGHDN